MPDYPLIAVMIGLAAGIVFVLLFSAFAPSIGIIFRASMPGSVNLSTNVGESIEPEIASSAENRYIIWSDRSQENTELFFKRSNDAGRSFYGTQNLSQDASDSNSPKVTAFGDNAYVIWENQDPISSEILLRASTDRGVNFGDTINISNSSALSRLPQIVSSANGIYMVWLDKSPSPGDRYDVMFRMGGEGANNLGHTLKLSQVDDDVGSRLRQHAWNPQITLSPASNMVFIVWQQASTDANDIFFTMSVDGGYTFSTPKAPTTTRSFSYDPRIMAVGNHVYVIWTSYDRHPESTEVIFSRSIDGGETFSAPVNLSNSTTESNSPQLAVSDKYVHVAWSEYTKKRGDEIYLRSSRDHGSTFSPITNLSNDLGASIQPQLAAFGSNAYVIWGNGDVFYKGIGGGGTFFSNNINLSKSLDNSFNHQLVVEGTRLYVVWQESQEIYFRAI